MYRPPQNTMSVRERIMHKPARIIIERRSGGIQPLRIIACAAVCRFEARVLVMAEHEDRVVIGRVRAPPAFPVLVGPGAAQTPARE
jgi:hypothetical protein